MTREEMVDLVQFIGAICPQQKIDRATAIPWYDVIGDLDYAEARAAVIAVKHSQAFVDVSDIIREYKRAGSARPYERTARQALKAANRRELDAVPPSPPTEEFRAALTDLRAKLKLKAERAMTVSRETERRASDWIDYRLTGKLPREIPFNGKPAPQWQQLPGDPPELRNWLARQARDSA